MRINPRVSRFVKQGGFTLIEVMVVVVIVGVLFVSAITLTTRQGREPAQVEADRFSVLFELARQEAFLSARVVGIGFAKTSYAFYRLDDDWQWRLVEEGQLQPKTLPDGVTAALNLNALPVELKIDLPKAPQLRILGNGESSPFELELIGVNQAGLVHRDLLGRDPDLVLAKQDDDR